MILKRTRSLFAGILLIFAASMSYSTQIYADQQYTYDGEKFHINVEYEYIGAYGDYVNKSSLFPESTSFDTDYKETVHYGGKAYSSHNGDAWQAYITLPAFEVGKKLIFDGMPKPDEYDFAWNRPYTAVLGEPGRFQWAENLYSIFIPLVKKGEKLTFAKDTDAYFNVRYVEEKSSLYEYTGEPVTPAVKVFQNDMPLWEGIDYTVSYQNNVDVGQAKILVKGQGIYQGTIEQTFSIYKPNVFPTGISIKDVSSNLAVGKTMQLSADVTPDNCSFKNVTWKSSNTKYASVSDTGLVKANKAGLGKTVTITATTTVGKSAGSTKKLSASVKIRIVNNADSTKKGNKITVTFNANGGSVSTKTISVRKNAKLGTLPAPKRKGYRFTGWFTKKKAGTQMKASSKAGSKSFTLYAHWKKYTIPQKAVTHGKHTYYCYDKKMNWSEAKKYCEKLGGHLVTITSTKEQKFITKLVKNGKTEHYWLGAQISKNNKWTKWITGEKIKYTNWDVTYGEPNGSGKYMQLYNEKQYYIGVWDDTTADENNGFICEWDFTAK